ncbi:hypothetical protein BHY_1214 (plasmid) [Borrelia nietonii YOR]|uniref:Uncharacterized protein n=2 Tax=Borrelia TaxID=138 RepID=W5SB46_9SPIR|nr:MULTISPECIES: hypothetical protein [Borrelia]AHH04165.1 hypothetical protein BHY_1214 [Borrelia nietonii YOR]AHH14440.1 hypothetical protein BHW_0900009 [Borrelia hermsii MTW]UPA10024.1 hypothetical protein bhYOR_001369 [Borrelia nietonii YOR]
MKFKYKFLPLSLILSFASCDLILNKDIKNKFDDSLNDKIQSVLHTSKNNNKNYTTNDIYIHGNNDPQQDQIHKNKLKEDVNVKKDWKIELKENEEAWKLACKQAEDAMKKHDEALKILAEAGNNWDKTSNELKKILDENAKKNNENQTHEENMEIDKNVQIALDALNKAEEAWKACKEDADKTQIEWQEADMKADKIKREAWIKVWKASTKINPK